MVHEEYQSKPSKDFDVPPVDPTSTAANPPPPVAKTARRGLLRPILVAIGFAAIWWALNPGDTLSWIIGGPTVLMATAAILLLPASGIERISILGALRFCGYFAIQTVFGAVDVSLRAFNPRRAPRPVLLQWETDLPEGPALRLFANTITLLPGTLTARAEGRSLTIHLLDSDIHPGLDTLEARIRDLFLLPAQEPQP